MNSRPCPGPQRPPMKGMYVLDGMPRERLASYSYDDWPSSFEAGVPPPPQGPMHEIYRFKGGWSLTKIPQSLDGAEEGGGPYAHGIGTRMAYISPAVI